MTYSLLLGDSTTYTCSASSACSDGTTVTSAIKGSLCLPEVEVISIVNIKVVLLYLAALDMECWLLFRRFNVENAAFVFVCFI